MLEDWQRQELVWNIIAELPPNLELGLRILQDATKQFEELARNNFADYRLRDPPEPLG